MSEGRRLVLLRHGQTAWNLAGRAQGHADVALDATGEAQAREVGPRVARMYHPVRVWSSDLTRAATTAASVGRACGLAVEHDARLREYAVGAHRTGLTMQEWQERFPHEHAALLQGHAHDVPGREDDEDVIGRVVSAMDEAAEALVPGECGVLVGHGASLRTGLVAFLGWPLESRLTLGPLGNCRWILLEESAPTFLGGDWGWRMAGFNLPAGPDFVVVGEGG